VAPNRVGGLDGLRGLAALYVALSHTFVRAFPGYPEATGPFWANWLVFGHFAVVVFIVLSGFSLAVAPARSGWRLDGVARFARRRARRILPPYWAALVFSLLVAWLVLPQPGVPVPDARSVIVHGLLLQDVVDAATPNRAFWSIAVEAHLYVLFPLLLLAVRRTSLSATLAAATLVVAGVGVLAPHVAVAGWLMRVTPQFAVLFAVGVAAAGMVTGGAAAGERVRSWPWHWLALAAAAPVVALIAWKGSGWLVGDRVFWVDLALGPAVGCLLAAVATGRPAPLVRLLDSRPLRDLGGFSYSLYLTHLPVVVVGSAAVAAVGVERGVPSFLLSLAVVVPATVAFARVFAARFETPFQRPPAPAASVPAVDDLAADELDGAVEAAVGHRRPVPQGGELQLAPVAVLDPRGAHQAERLDLDVLDVLPRQVPFGPQSSGANAVWTDDRTSAGDEEAEPEEEGRGNAERDRDQRAEAVVAVPADDHAPRDQSQREHHDGQPGQTHDQRPPRQPVHARP
jgi:peptidoglycan/LPS O-acetylase OafA/YrhL